MRNAIGVTPPSGSRSPYTQVVTPMLARLSRLVAMLKVITVSSFPQTISLRFAGLDRSVSSVPRSFSPAHKSIAG